MRVLDRLGGRLESRWPTLAIEADKARPSRRSSPQIATNRA